jgi:CBS domain-containing protein
VCDARGRVVGVVTDRDLAVRVCAQGGMAEETLVGSVMTPDVVACRPGHPVGHAERLMSRHHVSRVFVTRRDGVLVGVLSLSDVAQFERPARVARTLAAIAERKYRPESP